MFFWLFFTAFKCKNARKADVQKHRENIEHVQKHRNKYGKYGENMENMGELTDSG